MMMFILMCAQVFALSFRGLQGEALIEGSVRAGCPAARTLRSVVHVVS